MVNDLPCFIAIDPGPTQSAHVIFERGELKGFGQFPNEDFIGMLRWDEMMGATKILPPFSDTRKWSLVIEETQSYGKDMHYSAALRDTVRWSGRFEEAWHPWPVVYLPRTTIKAELCGKSNSKDKDVRHQLIERYGGTGGKRKAVGLKKEPGPLYGISGDIWAALAVGVVYNVLSVRDREDVGLYGGEAEKRATGT